MQQRKTNNAVNSFLTFIFGILVGFLIFNFTHVSEPCNFTHSVVNCSTKQVAARTIPTAERFTADGVKIVDGYEKCDSCCPKNEEQETWKERHETLKLKLDLCLLGEPDLRISPGSDQEKKIFAKKYNMLKKAYFEGFYTVPQFVSAVDKDDRFILDPDTKVSSFSVDIGFGFGKQTQKLLEQEKDMLILAVEANSYIFSWYQVAYWDMQAGANSFVKDVCGDMTTKDFSGDGEFQNVINSNVKELNKRLLLVNAGIGVDRHMHTMKINKEDKELEQSSYTRKKSRDFDMHVPTISVMHLLQHIPKNLKWDTLHADTAGWDWEIIKSSKDWVKKFRCIVTHYSKEDGKLVHDTLRWLGYKDYISVPTTLNLNDQKMKGAIKCWNPGCLKDHQVYINKNFANDFLKGHVCKFTELKNEHYVQRIQYMRRAGK